MERFDIDPFAIRDATDGDGRTLEGVAVTYGQPVRGTTREYGAAVEYFARGAFAEYVAAVGRGERIPVTDDHTPLGGGNGEVVGYIDRLWETDTGLHYAGRLLDVQAARDFAARVAARVMHMSIEFLPGEVRRAGNTITHVRVKALGAIAGSHFPAYAGTSVSVREAGGTSVAETTDEALPAAPAVSVAPVAVSQEQMAQIAQRITDDAIRAFAARAAFGGDAPADPFAEWRGLSLGDMAARALEPDAERGWAAWPKFATRALDDIVTTSGANAGMVTPGVFGDIHGIVSRGRPAITAFGGPRPIPGESGMTVDWPYFDGTLTDFVAAQSAEKAAIETAVLNIKKGSEALATYAGGGDISYQLLRRATRPYLEAYYRILLTAWGVVTDAAFVTELETGTVTSDFAEALSAVDATEFKNLLVDASIAVQTATGQPAEFVLASTTAFTQFAKLYTPIVSMPTVTNTGTGTIDLANLRVNVGNLPLIHVPSVTAGKLIVSNREAAAWYEDGPFQAQAEDVEKLGRNAALWSMGAGARFIPAGIIEMYDVSP